MEKIIPIKADRVHDYISEDVFRAIMEGVAGHLAGKRTGQSYWMATQEVLLENIPELLNDKCQSFKTVVVCNYLDDRPLNLIGFYIFCADTLTDMEAINLAQRICYIPTPSLS